MEAELSALLGKARASLAAQELADLGYHAFSASRAYYAMFYAAEALLLHRGLAFSSHGAVIGAFGRLFSGPQVLPRELHRHLTEAFRVRQLADYDCFEEGTPEGAAAQIQRAREFVTAAEGYLAAQEG